MTWIDELRPASFRGIAFLYAEAGQAGGRRVETHEFAGRDTPYHEDLGRRGREFPLRVFVMGGDYMARRDLLIAALEKPGAGRLVHPFRGELDVVARDYRVTETTARGGFAEFDIVFLEQGANLFPRASANSRATIRAEADGTITTVKSRFEDVFSVRSRPSLIPDGAVFDVVSAADAALRAARRVIAAPADFARFTRDVGGLKASASSLVFAPGDLIDGLANSIRGLVDMSFLAGLPLAGAPAGPGTSATRARDALVELQDFGASLPPVPRTTPARTLEAANQDAVVAAVAGIAAAEEARVAAAMEFDSAQAARAARDGLAERLAARIEAAGDGGDDAGFAAFSALRASAVTHLSALARGLPPVETFAVGETVPALVIANRLYGDDPGQVEGRAADIAARNRVRHPGFVTGGRTLEVLAAGAGAS